MAGTGTSIGLIRPDWPAPSGVAAVATTRVGGYSDGAYQGLNLAQHVGDDPSIVHRNRERLAKALELPESPGWLDQRHGCHVVEAGQVDQPADAVFSGAVGEVCAVLTADCLPVLLTCRDGQHVAAVHAGWRGLQAGIVEACVNALVSRGAAVPGMLAWLGPAIGPEAYEVGAEVRDAFLERDPGCDAAFRAGRPGHWQMDLYAAAQRALSVCGIDAIYGGGFCTAADPRFFSHRRDGRTGRQATLIWRRA